MAQYFISTVAQFFIDVRIYASNTKEMFKMGDKSPKNKEKMKKKATKPKAATHTSSENAQTEPK